MEVGQMAALDPDARNVPQPGPRVPEHAARPLPGLPMLALGIVVLLAGCGLLGAASRPAGGTPLTLGVVSALVRLAGVLTVRGLTPVVAGKARVVQLFGRYQGTIREPGLQWVNPFTLRIVVSTRI